MKTALLCFLLQFSLLFVAEAQSSPAVVAKDGKGELELVVATPGSQDELFIRGKDWLFKTYNSGKTVEQYEDKAAGRLVAHARTASLPWKAGLGITNDAGDFSYDLALDFKEGKARMMITNITYKRGVSKNAMLLNSGANIADDYPANWATFGKKAMTAHWREMQELAKGELVAIAQSFQTAIAAKPKDF